MARGDTKDAVAALAAVTVMPGLESRHYLQAWHFLRGLGQQPPGDFMAHALLLPRPCRRRRTRCWSICSDRPPRSRSIS
jgi:hypothetical protein